MTFAVFGLVSLFRIPIIVFGLAFYLLNLHISNLAACFSDFESSLTTYSAQLHHVETLPQKLRPHRAVPR
jgi:hypothetical protein